MPPVLSARAGGGHLLHRHRAAVQPGHLKKHPEAASARNMLRCVVTKLYATDWLIAVELDCQGNSLIVEIVPQSVEELDIQPGSELIAVFKASAFRRL